MKLQICGLVQQLFNDGGGVSMDSLEKALFKVKIPIQEKNNCFLSDEGFLFTPLKINGVVVKTGNEVYQEWLNLKNEAIIGLNLTDAWEQIPGNISGISQIGNLAQINANIKSKREIGAGKIILNLPIKPISMQYPTVSVDEGQYRLQLSPDGTLITTEIIPIGTSLHLDFSYISKEV